VTAVVVMPASARRRSAFSSVEVFVFMVDKVQTGCDTFWVVETRRWI
jgi:hypothetical protein